MVSNLDPDFEILQGSIDQIMHANTTGGLGLGILDMELFSPGIENQMDQVQLVKKKKEDRPLERYAVCSCPVDEIVIR
jgi:hypothetical protein